MRAILLPVKLFRDSKRRLAPYYSDAARAALAAALCEDVFHAVAQVSNIDRVYVVSQESRALERARGFEWATIVETEQVSESRSIDAASLICAAQGVTACLRLPIDLPLVEPADIAAIFEELEDPPAALLVPSRDGTGTNALLRAPPDLFHSRFGPNSFALHLYEAERLGARVKILRNPRIALDIDEVDDLRALRGLLKPGCATAEWIARHV